MAGEQWEHEEQPASSTKKPRFMEIQSGVNPHAMGGRTKKKKLAKSSLGERLKQSTDVIKQSGSSIGNMQMSFTLKSKKASSRTEEANKHQSERRKIRRSAGKIMKPSRGGKFWMGRRVN